MLNPIFGFASFLALLATIFYQAKELNASTKELKNSASALAAQNKAIELQSFEQTLFSWLNAYSSLLSAIKYEQNSNSTPHTISGRSALNKFWENHIEHLTNSLYPIDFSNPSKGIYDIKKAWESLYKEEEYQLDSLFRTLYRLFLWIDSQHESRLAKPQKWLYASIIRSQLSWIEMVYLYYNGLTTRGFKFKAIVEKYALFDNLTFDSNIGIELIKNHLPTKEFYSCEAFDSELARVKLGLPKSSEETLALATTASHPLAAPLA